MECSGRSCVVLFVVSACAGRSLNPTADAIQKPTPTATVGNEEQAGAPGAGSGTPSADEAPSGSRESSREPRNDADSKTGSKGPREPKPRTFQLVDTSGETTEITLACSTMPAVDSVMQSCVFTVAGAKEEEDAATPVRHKGNGVGFLLAETTRCGKHANIGLEGAVARGNSILVTLEVVTLSRTARSWPASVADHCSSRHVKDIRTIELEYELEGGRLKERKGMPDDLAAEIAWYESEAEDARGLREAEERAKKAREEER